MIQTCIAIIAFQTTLQIQKTQMTSIRTSCQNTPLYIHNENTHPETLLATHTYSIMTHDQVPYQTIEYNDNGMFTTKLMNDTPIEIFIDNGATPSILPLRTYNKFPILHTYPKTESNTPIHIGGGLITSHFWLEIPLKLQHQTIQIKAL